MRFYRVTWPPDQTEPGEDNERHFASKVEAIRFAREMARNIQSTDGLADGLLGDEIEVESFELVSGSKKNLFLKLLNRARYQQGPATEVLKIKLTETTS